MRKAHVDFAVSLLMKLHLIPAVPVLALVQAHKPSWTTLPSLRLPAFQIHIGSTTCAVTTTLIATKAIALKAVCWSSQAGLLLLGSDGLIEQVGG